MAMFDNPIDPGTQGLLALASGLLSSGGASRMPVTFGAALGQGTTAGLNAFNDSYKTNALIGLEQQKAALTQAQVNAALRQQSMSENILKQYGLLPSNNALQGESPALVSSPMGDTTTQPALSNQPTAALSPQSNISVPQGPTQLPGYAGQALALDAAMNNGKGMAGVITGALGPKEIQGVGSVQFNPKTGQYEALPGLANAMSQWEEAKANVANKNTTVEIKLPNGQIQRLTKAQDIANLNRNQNLPPVSSNVNAQVDPNNVQGFINDMQNAPVADRQAALAAFAQQNPSVAAQYGVGVNQGLPGVATGPTSTQASEQTDRGKALAAAEAKIDQDANVAADSNVRLNQMAAELQNFEPGKAAKYKQLLIEYAAGIPGVKIDQKQLDAAGSMEAVNKIALGLAAQDTRQFSTRPTERELAMFREANPNAALLPEGLQKVMMAKWQLNNIAVDKQAAKEEWIKSNNGSLQGFETDWNKQVQSKLATPNIKLTNKPLVTNYTDADIRNTAMKYNISVDQVKKKLGIQ